MASRREIEEQIAALQAELEKASDEDHEVWIKDGGREYKVTGSRAQKILDRWADLWAEEGHEIAHESEEEAEHEAEKGGLKEPEVKREDAKPAGYFRRK